jgi:hypothetical protein
LFSYYTSKEKMMRGVRRGCVRLSGAILGIDDEVLKIQFCTLANFQISIYEVISHVLKVAFFAKIKADLDN